MEDLKMSLTHPFNLIVIVSYGRLIVRSVMYIHFLVLSLDSAGGFERTLCLPSTATHLNGLKIWCSETDLRGRGDNPSGNALKRIDAKVYQFGTYLCNNLCESEKILPSNDALHPSEPEVCVQVSVCLSKPEANCQHSMSQRQACLCNKIAPVLPDRPCWTIPDFHVKYISIYIYMK